MADRWVDADADRSEQTYALFTHLSIALFLFTGVLVLQAVVLWLIRRNDSPFLNDHGLEAIRFQLSLLLYGLMLVPISFLTLGIGIIFYLPLIALGIVGPILAAQAANRGEFYRYPMTLRFF